MTSVTGPEEYTSGLGEVIRAHRLYIGLSRPAMAKKLDMAFRTYERIEDGNRECPPGLIDTMREVVLQFDNAVEEILKSGIWTPRVYPGEDYEWDRAVMGRAALVRPIRPVLVR